MKILLQIELFEEDTRAKIETSHSRWKQKKHGDHFNIHFFFCRNYAEGGNRDLTVCSKANHFFLII